MIKLQLLESVELDSTTILEKGSVLEWAEHPMQHDDFVSVRLPDGRIEWVFHTFLKEV